MAMDGFLEATRVKSFWRRTTIRFNEKIMRAVAQGFTAILERSACVSYSRPFSLMDLANLTRRLTTSMRAGAGHSNRFIRLLFSRLVGCRCAPAHARIRDIPHDAEITAAKCLGHG